MSYQTSPVVGPARPPLPDEPLPHRPIQPRRHDEILMVIVRLLSEPMVPSQPMDVPCKGREPCPRKPLGSGTSYYFHHPIHIRVHTFEVSLSRKVLQEPDRPSFFQECFPRRVFHTPYRQRTRVLFTGFTLEATTLADPIRVIGCDIHICAPRNHWGTVCGEMQVPQYGGSIEFDLLQTSYSSH